MSLNLSRSMQIRKTVIETEHGVVAAQHRLAAVAGAEVLAAGGDAVDAAVATSFVIGVLEPWMSGPAGGGATMLWRADKGRALALNHGMRAPAALDPADYPLSGQGAASDLFPWEHVVDDRNVQGATAIAVPGVVDGLGQAHARFGRMPWAELLSPAIDHAKRGMLVDWFASLVIASCTRQLADDSDAAALFLEDGQWPMISGWTALADKRLDQSRMADSLDQIARHGARTLYDGDLGAAMAADVQAKGGSLSVDDLRAYRAEFHDPLAFDYRDVRFHVVPGLTAGPTFRDAFAGLETVSMGDAPGPDSYAAMADALKTAYARRLEGMGDTGESPQAPGCTTHFSVVDRQGNMVAQTQTLLSIFGSRVVSPSTGFLMNNGIMWFDPVQGRPNSLGPGKRCLMNVCPVIGEQGDRRFAFGASGGRKILGAVAQLSSFVTDFGMDLDRAFHQPRIDVSGDTLIADDSLSTDVLDRLRQNQPVAETRRTIFPYAFACPAGVMRRGNRNSGCTEIMSPWGDAISEDMTKER
ncbi:gamma-glutamyltransferase [Citreimonas salinaria]|uniref:Gamma-glutamyltransferase 1 Threonine peptidase. MEROPS family T03 n=1 Tax=Citreimonas salinaria TaxID=321339 RepID=A0A1H3L1X8_9RHOB|nr:gamma-glutamyltransferase [Citreimonas salinaria]SDY58229.1 gamma-glutamyltransferase 1 Threonine peptidase. MEROPS family T03 [Citreimonas salinaria]